MPSAAAFASNHILEHIGSVHMEKLESFPMELLTEILKDLEWRDVLRVRRVCRRLYDASKSLDLWLYLFRLYASTSLIPPCLEAPIDTYSQEDLEFWLLRRIGADIGWQRDAKKPTLRRIINNDESGNFHLIEGGRWLIVVPHLGPVMCYDLDAPGGVKSEVLIDMDLLAPVRISPRGVLTAIDMLPESPTLSFNLVVILLQAKNTDVVTTSIFNVSLVGNGRSAKLEATSLLSHSCDNPILQPNVVDLCGTYLATVSQTVDGHDFNFFLDVIDWKKMRGTDYPRRTAHTPLNFDSLNTCIRLLPDGRVVWFFESVVTVDSPEARQIVTSPGNKSPWAPTWELDIGPASLHFLHISQGLFDATSGSYSFIFSTQTNIQQLVIPSIHTVSPFFGPVMPYIGNPFNQKFLTFGKHRGFNFPPEPPLQLLTYGSDIPANPPSDGIDKDDDWCIATVGYSGGRHDGRHDRPNFDEATGRVVIGMLVDDSYLRIVRHIEVLDFGVYPSRY